MLVERLNTLPRDLRRFAGISGKCAQLFRHLLHKSDQAPKKNDGGDGEQGQFQQQSQREEISQRAQPGANFAAVS